MSELSEVTLEFEQMEIVGWQKQMNVVFDTHASHSTLYIKQAKSVGVKNSKDGFIATSGSFLADFFRRCIFHSSFR
jgi:hypothetical protein